MVTKLYPYTGFSYYKHQLSHDFAYSLIRGFELIFCLIVAYL